MSNYVKNFTETFDFDDDKVVITLKQLSRIDAMVLMPAMANMQGMKPDHMKPEDIDNSNKFVEAAAKVIKDGGYVQSMSGLMIGGVEVIKGSPEMDLVLSDFYFTPLVTSIAMALIRRGALSKAVEKKSAKQPSVIDEDLETKAT